MLALLTASLLLVQCAMPPQQAWQYIQTNGLLPYLSYSTHNPSPPFRTGASSSQRYAASSAYPLRRSYPGYSNWSSGMPNRSRLGAPAPRYSPNSYFAAPSSHSAAPTPRYIPRSKSGSSLGQRSPAVKLPVDEPSPAPKIVNNPPPASPTPKSNSSAPAPASSTADLPYGTTIPGRANMVNSPYAGKTQLVDVSGMSAGQTVKCPYTGKLFKVPPTQQAANHAEPRNESKAEAPKLSDEPKTEGKKP